jgi:hypothetical protein
VESTVPLRYSWDWTRDEHIRVHKAISRYAGSRWWTRGVLGAVALIVAAFAVESIKFGADVVPQLLPWILICGFWVFLLKWWPARASARVHTKLHRGPHWLELGSEAVESGCDLCSMRQRWEMYKRAVETPEFFLLFYTPNCAVYLPKRMVGGTEQLQRVRDLLQARLGRNAAMQPA